MKKIHVYAVILAVLLAFAALAAVYQRAHPGRPTPEKTYTELKATYITADYRVTAEQMQIDKDKRGSYVYAALVEYPTPDLEKNGVSAELWFYDLNNRLEHVTSDGAADPEVKAGADPSDVTAGFAAMFDEGFKAADKTDYGIPEHGYVKLYLRRGDGVYFKIYEESAFPYKRADMPVKAATDTAEEEKAGEAE